MIRSVKVTNPRNSSLLLELYYPERSGYMVAGIDGLGPVTANVNYTEIATMDGAIYNSARVPVRNIVFHLIYDEDTDDIEVLRHKLYKYFPIKQKIDLEFITDKRTVTISGIVESNEVAIFSSLEGSDISILCPDPYFYKVGIGNETVFSVEEPMFEFDFEDEDDVTPSLVMSSLDIYQTKLITYEGDTDTGIIITIHAAGSASNLVIYNYLTGESMSIDTTKLATLTGSGITAGDDIIISTVKGNKYVHLIRSGVTTNILNCLNRNATWLQMIPGDNIFAYVTDPTEGALNLQIKMNNKIVYAGI